MFCTKRILFLETVTYSVEDMQSTVFALMLQLFVPPPRAGCVTIISNIALLQRMVPKIAIARQLMFSYRQVRVKCEI